MHFSFLLFCSKKQNEIFFVHDENHERQSRLTNSSASADSLTGKDGTKWVPSRMPESAGRIQQQNIIRKQPGTKPFVAARVSTVGDAWFEFSTTP